MAGMARTGGNTEMEQGVARDFLKQRSGTEASFPAQVARLPQEDIHSWGAR